MAKKITEQVKITPDRLKEIKKEADDIKQLRSSIKKTENKQTTKLLEVCLGGAINLNASDIHIEPEKKEVKLRFRIDGVLHDVAALEKGTYDSLLSRIKLLSGIKLNITDKPQDGRFTILSGDTSVETRISTLPSEYGESTVIRILNPENLIEIEELGLRKEVVDTFKKQIHQPNGMIIVTGPTGSGKTTTLYAVLRRLKKPEIKIITIEDPIEYHLPGISQTQVKPEKGYDFASGLEAVVRQDPDAILVGEIRNFETAKIALQAALTGHFVFSTLHTNDAAGTIVRLQALGEKPVNIAPAINMVVGQRLVRKVCKECAREKKVTPEELKFIKEQIKSLPEGTKAPEVNENTTILKAEGCSNCNFTGYKGRIGIFEIFVVDSKMEKMILESPSIAELRKKAKEKGMVNMREDGIIKVLKKDTTLEEIKRVTGE